MQGNPEIVENSETSEGLEINSIISKFDGEQDEKITKDIADEIKLQDFNDEEGADTIVSTQKEALNLDPMFSNKTFEFVNMNQLIQDLPDNEAINEYIKPKEDLPDVITLEDIIKYEYRYDSYRKEDLIKFLEEWKFVESKEDARYPYAHKSGGRIAENEKVIKKLRTIAKGVIIAIGKKLLSGEFNLTTVSFPIKAMIPRSVLDNIATMTCYYPLYLNLALKTKDPLERFKFYLTSQISYFWVMNSFGKPLNPILGETLVGHYTDGSRVFCEQTSHHPPVSYLLYYGPRESYRVYGPVQYAANAGLNSLNITPKGWRRIEFADTKQVITNTFPKESFDGTFIGTCVSETKGEMNFEDKKNAISCKIAFGKMKKKPSDYFEADILLNGKPVSQVTGTYLGWIEIDKQRYFDFRYTNPFKIIIEKTLLNSDSILRPDIKALNSGDYSKAQTEKENLEQNQRNDAKLRKLSKKH